MYKYRKIISIAAAMLILFGALGFGGADRVRAIEPGLYEIDGNATCANLHDNTTWDLSELGPLLGIKYDSSLVNGVTITHNLTNDSPWGLEGVSPTDEFNSITISNVHLEPEGQVFDWSATLKLSAVIVKGGDDSNAYVYIPPTYGDGALHAPENRSGGYANVSHISFCYNYALDAVKTADAKVYKTIDWTIEKDVTPASASKFIGESTQYDYTVTVTKEETFEWVVDGTITVKNPYIEPVVFEISDEVGGVPADVDCGEVTQLAANDGAPGGPDEVICTYSISSATEIADGSNVATVISKTEGVGGYVTDPVPFEFGPPILSGGSEPELITVGDTNVELPWSTGVSATWDYSVTQTCSSNAEDYEGDGFYSDTFDNTATINETTGDSDSETVTLNCYAPVVSKTAAGTYDEVHYWKVTKTVDPLKQSGFIGDTVYFDWTIDVDEDVVDENHAIAGKISVDNPAPMPMTVSISDVLDDGTSVTLDCGGTLTIPAGETGECPYSALPDDTDATLNTATATLNEIGFDATAKVVWSKTVVDGEAELFDDQKPYSEESVYDGWTGTYEGSYTCSTNLGDYIAGADLGNKVDNQARIYSDGVLLDYSDAATLIDCYIPSISKTAAGTYDERHEWYVDKTVDPASQSAFIGDTVIFDWTIKVTEDVFEENFDVAGSITVVNPNPEDALVVNLSDKLSDDTFASITECTGGTFVAGTLTVPASGTAICDYEANDLAYTDVDSAPTLNTASFYLNKVLFSDDDLIEYTANIIRGSATLDDDQFIYDDEAVYDGWTSTYEDSYTCSTDLGDYTDGMYLDNEVINIAEVYSGGALEDSSTAKTYIDCYAPVVEKTAVASYDETHTWDIEKVASEPVSGYPGDTLNWTWTVNVSEKSADSNFKVVGEITIFNPALADMTVSVVDQLSDGTSAVVDCGVDIDEAAVLVPAGETVTCSYVALPSGKTATENEATVGFNGLPFTALADVNFVANVINGTATVIDDQIGLEKLINAGDGPWEFSGSGSHVCSSDASAYDKFGQYGETLYNTAVVTGSDGQTDSDDASTSYLCEAGFMDLLKLTNGLQDPMMVWNFKLYTGGFGGTEIGSDSTPPSLLDFGNPALRPDTTYTICELGIPAGYTSFWSLDLNNDRIFDNGDTVLPYVGGKTGNLWEVYDPTFGLEGAVNDTRCVDFKVSIGQTTHFLVDNQMGGGEPRTIGYWKNWAYCTGGGQYATAQINGGAEKGWWTLDDLLPQWVGPLYLAGFGGNPSDYEGDYCAEIGIPAINILNKSTLDGSKMANDAAYELAAQMLATKLNLSAGACVPTAEQLAGTGYSSMDEMLAAADALLENIEIKKNTYLPFDGLGSFLGPKNKSPQRAEAFWLASLFDNYNNSEYCTGDPTH